MSAESLIDKLEAELDGEPIGPATHYNHGLLRAIAIIRQHEADPPDVITPQEIASCTVLQMHGKRLL